MPKWYTIGDLGQYQDKNQWLIKINKRPIALFKYINDFFAIKNSCAHQGYPLSEGNLKDYMVDYLSNLTYYEIFFLCIGFVGQGLFACLCRPSI